MSLKETLRQMNRKRKWLRRAKKAQERKRRLLSFGAHARGILVETEQGLYVVDPEDDFVSKRLLTQGRYATDELVLANTLVSSQSRVLVVGTHIGTIAVPLSKSVRELVAVEANPYTYTLLTANFRLNDCRNVTTYNLAASDVSGTIEFLVSRDNSGGSKRRPVKDNIAFTYDNPELVKVDAEALDNLFEDLAFDLVFMDIEGSEYFALKGMPEILAKSRHLVVEFLPHHLRDVAGIGVADFASLLMPVFDWMYIPKRQQLVANENILDALEAIYAADENHDNLVFTNQPPVAWMHKKTG